MYLHYFGLKEPPFSIAPNPRYLFMSERHREALAHLVYGLQGTGGFVVLTGEVGAGKTTLARRFMEEIPATCHVAYLINPNVTVTEMLQTICDEFGIKIKKVARRADEAPSNKAWVDGINAFLLSEYAAGRNCVVLVDEAQNLSPEVMEQLRLLTNLETDERKLLQIILIGQPELRDLLARHDLRQVDQRVVARYHLDSLDPKDTEQYIAHRLSIAGGQRDLFAPAAAASVHQWTDGVPRRINVLADRALLGAYAQGLPQVTQAMINTAAGEVFQGKGGASKNSLEAHAFSSTESTGWKKPAWWAAGLAAAAAIAYASLGTGALSIANVGKADKAPATAAKPAPTNTPASLPKIAEVSSIKQVQSTTSISSQTTPPRATLASLIANASADATQRQAPARELLQRWRIAPASALDEPFTQSVCEAAAEAQLACYAGKTGLESLRANNHPALISLVQESVTLPALLEKLDATTASLMIGNTHAQVSLGELAQAWQGDFVLLWKPLYAGAGKAPLNNLSANSQGNAVTDLLTRLDLAKHLPPALAAEPALQSYDKRVESAVRAFQMSQELTPDGLAGPQTLVRLNALAFPELPQLDTAATARATARKP